MKELENLLQRFKRSLDKDLEAREVIASIIKERLGFDVRLTDIFIKGDSLHIKTSPAKKNEIRLHEAFILESSKLRTKLNLKRIVY